MTTISEAVGVGLGSFHHVVDVWRAGKADSLIDYTRPARVEPIVLVDTDVLFGSDMTPEIMQSLLSTFAGYYLQAAALSLTVGKVNILRHLDRLSPSRSPLESAVDGPLGNKAYMLATENYHFRLPRVTDQVALESNDRYDLLPFKLPSPMEVALEEYTIAMEATYPAFDPNNPMSQDESRHRQDHRQDLATDLAASQAAARARMDQQRLGMDRNKYAHTLRKDRSDTALRREQAAQSAAQHAATLALQTKNAAATQAHQAAQLRQQKDQSAASQANQDASLALREQELALREQQLTDAQTSSQFGYGKETIQTIKELSNLSVGKLLSVEVTDGNHSASIPVAVRLMAASLPSSSVAHILSLGKKDTSFMARWHGWRSGRLSFWKDLVLCNDLIDEHRNALMSDKDGLFRQIVARKTKNRFAGILSGNPSVATASNMAVISKETADKIELESMGTLNNFSVRQKLFEPTSLMILVVVNKAHDIATFYYRGIAEKSELTLRDLKAANKGNGPDITDVLKAFTQGHAPSL